MIPNARARKYSEVDLRFPLICRNITESENVQPRHAACTDIIFVRKERIAPVLRYGRETDLFHEK